MIGRIEEGDREKILWVGIWIFFLVVRWSGVVVGGEFFFRAGVVGGLGRGGAECLEPFKSTVEFSNNDWRMRNQAE